MLRFLTFFLALFAFGAAAQENALKLDQALNIVKKNNTEIALARHEARIAEYKTKLAASKQYGRLDLSTSAVRSNDAGNVFGFKLASREADFGDFGFEDFLNHKPDPMDSSVLTVEPDDLNYPGPRNHFETKIAYSVPLYTGGKLNSYEKIARSLQRLSRLEGEKIVRQKLYETKKSFYDISLLHSYRSDLDTLENNLDTLYDTVAQMHKEGYAKEVDVFEVEAKKARITELIEQAAADEMLAYDYLSFLLDRPVSRIAYKKAPLAVPKADTQQYIDNDIDTKMVQTGLQVAKQQLKAQNAAFLPQVKAFAQYGSSDNTFLNDFGAKDSYTVGARLEWNLFNGGGDSARMQVAKIKRAKQASQLKLAKDAAKLKVKKIRTRIKKLDASLRSLSRQKRFYKQMYENYRGRYKHRLADINDVVKKHSQLIETVISIKEKHNRRNKEIFALMKMLEQERL
ncbi:MAG: TolC family protein [Campylobacterota bacterium]